MNKKSQVGKEWIFGLSFLFAMTILYLTFNVVYNVHLAPVIIDAMPTTDAGNEGVAGIESWLNTWQYAPYILLGVVIIFLFIVTVRKEPVERSF